MTLVLNTWSAEHEFITNTSAGQVCNDYGTYVYCTIALNAGVKFGILTSESFDLDNSGWYYMYSLRDASGAIVQETSGNRTSLVVLGPVIEQAAPYYTLQAELD